MKKYKISTYGCQMNVHESEKIAGILRSLGYEECSQTDDELDIIVFNTCCIRDTAEKKIMGHIGRVKKMKKNNPSLICAILGCMSQQEGKAEDLKSRYPFIDIILGTSNLHELKDAVERVEAQKAKYISIPDEEKPSIHEDDSAYRTSFPNAWVNIMYGCNNFCTYCIVPHVKGRERSRNPEDIIAEINQMLSQGYKEITLLGQNVNSYGSDFNNGVTFAYLLRKIDEIEGDFRVRFMTSHPKDLNEEVIDIIAQSKNMCKYIHLPIQSGSNKILEMMNRHYTREDYLRIIDNIRAKIPDCGITTDIMVGFPNEEEEDFADTLDIVEKVKFSGAFTYIYSPRKGTPAAEMTQIPYAIKSERIGRLISKQNEITKTLSRTYEGKTYRVLCEDVKAEGQVCGRTDCGRLVNFNGDESMIGNFYDVEIIRSRSASLYGVIREEKL